MKARILIVDDDRQQREMLRNILELEGHDVMADDELPYFPEDAPRDESGEPVIRP